MTRRPRVSRIVVWVLMSIGLAMEANAQQAAQADGADTVFTNGKVYTVDAADHIYQAIAIKNGKIVALGSDASIRPHISTATTEIDLDGKMLMPGLIDAHMHPGGGGESLIACNLGYVSLTVDEILDQIKVCLAKEGDAPDKQWLRVHAWFRQATKPEGADLTAAILDQLPTKRPVVVLASDFHTLAANTAAMKVANINASTPNPSDGEIVRDRTGAATGIFLDGAMWAVIGAEPKLPPEIQAERALENIRAAIAEVNSQGVTAIFSAGGGDEVTLTAWNKLFDSGALTVRSNLAVGISPDEARNPEAIVANIRALNGTYAKVDEAERPGLTIDRAKIFVDGVIQAPAQTGALLLPYLHNVGTEHTHNWVSSDKSGSLYFDEQTLTSILEALVQKGLGAHMHTTGDRAIRTALDAIEAVRKRQEAPSFRPALAHNELVDPADYVRFARLDAIPVLSLQWGKPGPDTIDSVKSQVGPRRYPYLETAGKFHLAGARVTFGSDWPVDALQEWLAMQIAVTRTNPEPSAPRFQGRLGDDPGLDIATAIRAMTINAAYSLNIDDRTGSLEVGKYADLIVIDRDVTAIEPIEIAGTKVLLTMVGGREVYRDPGSP